MNQMIKPSAARKAVQSSVLGSLETQSDPQSTALESHTDQIGENVAYLRSLFGSESLIVKQESLLRQAAETRMFILRRRRDSIEAILDIGRALAQVQQWMPTVAFERFVTEESVGVSMSSASKYMAVANAVDGGFFLPRLFGEKYPIERLPAYATCYELTTLAEQDLRRADEANLIAPETTYAQVKKLKNDGKTVRRTNPDLVRQRGLKEARRVRLERELAIVEAEIRDLDQRLAARPEMRTAG